jgi:hypothetical protein
VWHIEPLREAVKCTRAERPSYIDVWVVLPESHALRDCPTTGDDAFSDRIKAIKSRFCTGAAADGGEFIGTNSDGLTWHLTAALPWRLPFGHCLSTSVPDGSVATAFFGSILCGTREIMCGIRNACAQPGQTWLCVAGCALAPLDISSVAGGRCLSTVGCCRRR